MDEVAQLQGLNDKALHVIDNDLHHIFDIEG